MYPRLLHIYGPLWINSYGFMIAVGLLIFVYLSYKDKKRAEIISPDLFFNTIFIGLIAAIIGGRILAVISEWKIFSQNFIEIFYPWIGGFSILGTILGILITIPIYLKYYNIPVLPVFDLIAIYAPLMQAISRIGCFLAGCCYGKVAGPNIFWSVIFTNPDSLAPLNIPLHPTQLYLSLASFLIFLIILSISKKFKYKNGQILFTYLILESISRFTIHFWRADQDPYSQPIAIGIFIFAIAGLIYTQKRN